MFQLIKKTTIATLIAMQVLTLASVVIGLINDTLMIMNKKFYLIYIGFIFMVFLLAQLVWHYQEHPPKE